MTPAVSSLVLRPMTLASVLEEYVAEREVSPLYVAALRRTLRKAAGYGISQPCQLTSELVNGWLENLRQAGVSAITRSNERRLLLTLWRFCVDRGYVECSPAQVRRIKVVKRPPQAWCRDTLMRLLEAAEGDKRRVSDRYPHVRWCDVLPVWIAIGFETGLRLGDLLLLRDTSFRNGCVCVVAAKTGKQEVKRLSRYATTGVSNLLRLSTDGTLFRWCVTRRRAMLKWKAWLQEQGIAGSSKYLRRSSFTYTELKFPGTAHRFANHSDPTLVWQHYIDSTLLSPPEGPDPLRQ